MATNPDTAGIPTVTPTESVPAPFQHLQAPTPKPLPRVNVSLAPAESMQQAGTELQGAGRTFTQMSEHWGEIAADDVSNQFTDVVNKLLRGDPNNPNPDGSPNLGYLGLKGKAALDQRKEYEGKLDKALADARKVLVTPDAQLRFDNFSRRYRAVASSQMGTHADTQGFAYASGTAQQEIKLNLDNIASNPNDAGIVKSSGAAIVQAHVKLAQLQGAQPGDPMFEEAKHEGLKQAAKAQILAVSSKDPLAAQRMIENYKGQLGTEYQVLADHVRARADDAVAGNAAGTAIDTAVSAALPPAGGAFTPAQIGGAIIGGESGGRQFNADGTMLMSDKGAGGIGQIIPSTWAQYALPGEKRENAADNKRVSGRIVDDLYRKFGGDWQRVAVGYFSGPGNVSAPGSLVPWVIDKSDGHSTTSQYVADKAVRLGVVDPLKARADAHAAIEGSNMTDHQKDLANSKIERRYKASEISSFADAKAKKDANDKAVGDWATQILTNPTADMRQKIAEDPRLEGHAKFALDDALQKHLKGDVEQASQVYGDGFWEARKRILLPPGDPNRLADVNDLLSMAGPGGHLTLGGVKELAGTMGAIKKDVDSHMVAQTQQSLMQYAKKRLSFEEETQVPGFAGLKDPAGEKIFHGKFVPSFLAAYDAWTKAGKNPWEFLTQENVDKMTDGLRPKKDMERDKQNAEGGGPGTPRAPIPPPPEGVNADTWTNLIGNPPINPAGKEFPIPVWTEAINRLRANPTPQMQAYFDKNFGASGYSAKEILERLSRAPEVPLPRGKAALPPRVEHPLGTTYAPGVIPAPTSLPLPTP